MNTSITLITIIVMVRMRNGKLRSFGAGSALSAAAWYSAVASAAVVAVGVELDRQARQDPAIASTVPSVFQGYALEVLVRDAVHRNDLARGRELSRRLVERRPMPAEPLSLYAAGLMSGGEVEEAIPALQLAAQRGWRDRFVQRVVILSALQSHNPNVAAERLLGLWRQGDQSAWVKDLTRTTLGQPAGMAAFGNAFVVREGNWVPSFLNWAASNLPAQTVEAVANKLSSRYEFFDCRALSGEAENLVRGGKPAQAVALWNATCGYSRPERVDVLTFEEPWDQAGPFSWHYPDSAGVSIDVVHGGGRGLIKYKNTDVIRHVVARRYLQLDPATYSLKVNYSESGVEWQMACLSKENKFIIYKSDYGFGQLKFKIPDYGCAVQELSAKIASGEGSIHAPVISISH